MTKKELVLTLLRKLTPYWDLAEWLIALIDSWYAEETAIEGLLSIMDTSMRTMQTGKAKARLERSVAYLEKLKVKQNLEEIEDKKDADIVLNDLVNWDL
jgi:hypothetical protein